MINAGVQVEPLLTNHVINYPVAGAVADIVCPRVQSETKGKYEVYDKSSFKAVNIKPRVGMTKAEVISLASGEEDYKTANYPIRMGLTDQFVKEQEKLGKDPRLVRSEQVKAVLTRSRELRVAAKFAAAANSVTLAAYNSSSNKSKVFFDDKTNSRPFDLIDYYISFFISQCGVYPSGCILNPSIEHALSTHPDFDAKSNQNSDRVSTGGLGQKLLNMEIVRAFLPYDSTKQGRTGSSVYAWGNNLVLFYRAADVSTESPTAAKTFDAGKFLRGYEGIAIREYLGDAGEPGVWVEGQEDVDEQITCPDAIFVIKNVLENPVPILG